MGARVLLWKLQSPASLDLPTREGRQNEKRKRKTAEKGRKREVCAGHKKGTVLPQTQRGKVSCVRARISVAFRVLDSPAVLPPRCAHALHCILVVFAVVFPRCFRCAPCSVSKVHSSSFSCSRRTPYALFQAFS